MRRVNKDPIKEESMDARLTYFLIFKIIKKTISVIIVRMGLKLRSVPKNVDTAFPPRKSLKIGKQWPIEINKAIE